MIGRLGLRGARGRRRGGGGRGRGQGGGVGRDQGRRVVATAAGHRGRRARGGQSRSRDAEDGSRSERASRGEAGGHAGEHGHGRVVQEGRGGGFLLALLRRAHHRRPVLGGPRLLEAAVLPFDVVFDLLAEELLARLGQDPGVAGLVRLHLDVVPARGTLGAEVDTPARQVGSRSEARVHLGILADHDASHRLVVDLDALRPGKGRTQQGEGDPHDDSTCGHAWSPAGTRSSARRVRTAAATQLPRGKLVANLTARWAPCQ